MEIKESNRSKSRRGGKRPGAGRKVGQGNRLTALRQFAPEIKSIKLIKGSAAQKAVTAAGVLGLIDEVQKWLSLLEAKTPDGVPDKRIQLDAMKFLTEQRDGKAKQKIDQTIDDKRKKEASVERVRQLLNRAIARIDSGAVGGSGGGGSG